MIKRVTRSQTMTKMGEERNRRRKRVKRRSKGIRRMTLKDRKRRKA